MFRNSLATAFLNASFVLFFSEHNQLAERADYENARVPR